MTTLHDESTSELWQRTSKHISDRMTHITEVVAAFNAFGAAWRLASERDADERAALDAAARRLAALLDCEVTQ